jgi:hypothetical protein
MLLTATDFDTDEARKALFDLKAELAQKLGESATVDAGRWPDEAPLPPGAFGEMVLLSRLCRGVLGA